MSKKCSQCGAPLDKGANFCGQCSYPVIKKQKSKAVRVMVSFLFSVLIILLGSLSAFGLSLRYMTRPDGIVKIVEEIEFAEIKTGFISDNSKKETLPELIHDSIPGALQKFFELKDIEKLVEKDFVKEFAAEQLSQYIEDVFYDTGDGVLETEEMEDFFDENDKGISKALGHDLTSSMYDSIIMYLEDEDIEKHTDLSELREDNEEIFTVIRIMGSYPVLIGCAVLCVVLLIGICCINGASSGAFKGMGINFAFLATMQFALVAVIPQIQSLLEDEASFGSNFYEAVFSPLKNQSVILGCAFLGVFVIFFFIGVIRKKVERKASC